MLGLPHTCTQCHIPRLRSRLTAGIRFLRRLKAEQDCDVEEETKDATMVTSESSPEDSWIVFIAVQVKLR